MASAVSRVTQNKYTPIAFMVIAVLLAGLAAWAVIGYLEKREAAIRQEIVGNLKEVSVVVASRDLLVGEVISEQNVSVRSIPETYVADATITPQDFDVINGLKLGQKVTAGKQLLRTSIKGLAGVATFSELIPVGNRAITLEVDVTSTNESMIVAGDYIDLGVVAKGKNSTGAAVGGFIVVLQKVLVMATGPITISEPPVNIVGYSEELYRYQSLTLSVPQEEVQKVYSAKAASDGKLTFLVRNPDDKSYASYSSSASKSRFIEVLSGGSANGGLLETKVAATTSVIKGQESGNNGRVQQIRRFGKFVSPKKEMIKKETKNTEEASDKLKNAQASRG